MLFLTLLPVISKAFFGCGGRGKETELIVNRVATAIGCSSGRGSWIMEPVLPLRPLRPIWRFRLPKKKKQRAPQLARNKAARCLTAHVFVVTCCCYPLEGRITIRFGRRSSALITNAIQQKPNSSPTPVTPHVIYFSQPVPFKKKHEIESERESEGLGVRYRHTGKTRAMKTS